MQIWKLRVVFVESSAVLNSDGRLQRKLVPDVEYVFMQFFVTVSEVSQP